MNRIHKRLLITISGKKPGRGEKRGRRKEDEIICRNFKYWLKNP